VSNRWSGFGTIIAAVFDEELSQGSVTTFRKLLDGTRYNKKQNLSSFAEILRLNSFTT